MKEFREFDFKEYQKYWYDKHVELFGKEQAVKMALESKQHDEILQQLWLDKGFKNVGECEDWVRDHTEERNAYFRERMDYDSFCRK